VVLEATPGGEEMVSSGVFLDLDSSFGGGEF
jgi:hypothetical protein